MVDTQATTQPNFKKLTKARSTFIRASFGMDTWMTKQDLNNLDKNDILAGEGQLLSAITP
jgi:hypothetical protein